MTDTRPRAPKPKRVRPTEWSMAEMTANGFFCGVTERFIHHTNTTIDLFGFIDFVAIGESKIVGVQCCARSGLSNHKRKMATLAYHNALRWLECGGHIEIHAWDRKEVKTEPGAKYQTKYNRRIELFVVSIDWLRETHHKYMDVPALTDEASPF